MTQVVPLDKVEVIRAPHQIRLLIGLFNHVWIHLLMALGGSVVVGLISTLIRP